MSAKGGLMGTKKGGDSLQPAKENRHIYTRKTIDSKEYELTSNSSSAISQRVTAGKQYESSKEVRDEKTTYGHSFGLSALLYFQLPV
jgi:hypothetical protein